jgi:hypothetical protein
MCDVSGEHTTVPLGKVGGIYHYQGISQLMVLHVSVTRVTLNKLHKSQVTSIIQLLRTDCNTKADVSKITVSNALNDTISIREERLRESRKTMHLTLILFLLSAIRNGLLCTILITPIP